MPGNCRTVATSNFKDTAAFVEGYSICPVVYEIQIVWPAKNPIPPLSDFTFLKTHSLVSFITDENQYRHSDIKTNGKCTEN